MDSSQFDNDVADCLFEQVGGISRATMLLSVSLTLQQLTLCTCMNDVLAFLNTYKLNINFVR